MADLYALAGVAAVQYAGGPTILFKMGRVTMTDEAEASKLHVIDEKYPNHHITDRILRTPTLTTEEKTALMGFQTIGFAFEDITAKNQRWTMNPYVFDNTYFQELLNHEDSKYLQTEADLKLLQDRESHEFVKIFADNQELWFEVYARAHAKFSEQGQEKNLWSEVNEAHIQEGGYHEAKHLEHLEELNK
jgi:L-ascorbate peroxidase